MSSQDDDGQQGLVLGLVFGLIALVIALVIGVGIYHLNHTAGASQAKAKPAAIAAALAPQDAAGAAQTASDAAGVKIENGVVKFYFASGKADLALGANAALADIVKGAQAGRKLVVSGFHDATGNAAQNAELAKLRAFAVRDTLKKAGVAEEKIELKKPEELKASSSNAEARRVEVSLQ